MLVQGARDSSEIGASIHHGEETSGSVGCEDQAPSQSRIVGGTSWSCAGRIEIGGIVLTLFPVPSQNPDEFLGCVVGKAVEVDGLF